MAYILHSSAHYCHIVTYIVTYVCNVLYGLVSDTLADHFILVSVHIVNS